jgi:NAD-dependent dihydropyrimidine dehydrogenase PreA subunit
MASSNGPVELKSANPQSPIRIPQSDDAARRWYPVIDYSRCTNCMECIDFCLFGVYGVDKVETILVEQPDNCRKGCPACSRVCPENAIIFPQHKTPTIAGAPVVAGSLKIDLSKLFGAPDTGESAEQAAIRERDEQLVLAGRAAVGDSVGLPKRHHAGANEPKDELDSLIDQLDNF